MGVGFLAFDPQDSNTIYTGTGAGVFKTYDGGASWSNAGLTGWSVAGLVIDPQNPSTLYAATGVYADDDSSSNKVYKSTDGGATWNEADSGLPAQGPCCIQLLAITWQNTARLYALAGGPPRQLFTSTDGGANWIPASGLPGRLYFLDVAIDPQDSSTVYAAGQGADGAGRPVAAVFKSRDGGGSWSEADSGLSFAVIGIGTTQVVPFGGLVIDPRNSSTLYITRLGVGVYKSTDGGASWRAANSGLPNLVDDYEFISCCGSGAVIDPQNPNILYAAGMNPTNAVIFKSTNGGANWKAISSLGPGSSYVDG